MKRDITEEVVHEIWLEVNGRIPKPVIREAATFIMSNMRDSFLKRKTIRIDKIGTFFISKGKRKLLEEKDKNIINGLEDTKNIN